MQAASEKKTQDWQCVLICWGDKYSNTEVNFLWEKITSYDPDCVQCTLLTDRVRDEINPSIKQKLIPSFYLSAEMLKSTHAKLSMFEEGILEVAIPAIYVDLDTLVFGRLGTLLDELKSCQNLMMIPGRGRLRKIRRFFAKYRGGLKFPRANSSVVVFYPKFWFSLAECFRNEIAGGAKLQGERLMIDDRYIAWFAQRHLQSVPKTHVVKFGTEFVLPMAWLSKLKSYLPWVRRRRANLIAITLPGNDFKVETLAILKNGDIVSESRGRKLFWNDKTIGVTQRKIIDYAKELESKILINQANL